MEPIITAAVDQLTAKEREEAELRGQADRLLAIRYPRRAHIGRLLADRGMGWCGRVLLVGVAVAVVGLVLLAVGLPVVGLGVLVTAVWVELWAVALMVVHGQWGVAYTDLRSTISRVIQVHGQEAAEALLAAYPRPNVRQMQDLSWELPRTPLAD